MRMKVVRKHNYLCDKIIKLTKLFKNWVLEIEVVLCENILRDNKWDDNKFHFKLKKITSIFLSLFCVFIFFYLWNWNLN